jgi:hypothetical protein
MGIFAVLTGCVSLAGASEAVSNANRTAPQSGEAPYHFLIGTANFVHGKEGPTEMYGLSLPDPCLWVHQRHLPAPAPLLHLQPVRVHVYTA